MRKQHASYYLINALTMYRLVSAPFLLLLAATGQMTWFKWLMLFSFFTDAIDGPLSRKFKVTSIFGSRLDSIADDATVLVSTMALFISNPWFILREWFALATIFALFLLETTVALVKYKRITSFHTYLAKAAAVFQAIFFFAFFFNTGLIDEIFYIATGVTCIQLVEEIVLVFVLPGWMANVKGLYWVFKTKKVKASHVE